MADAREEVERRDCPACCGRRVHTEEEWKDHPFAGHGYTKEHGWTHPALETEKSGRCPLKKV